MWMGYYLAYGYYEWEEYLGMAGWRAMFMRRWRQCMISSVPEDPFQDQVSVGCIS